MILAMGYGFYFCNILCLIPFGICAVFGIKLLSLESTPCFWEEIMFFLFSFALPLTLKLISMFFCSLVVALAEESNFPTLLFLLLLES